MSSMTDYFQQKRERDNFMAEGEEEYAITSIGKHGGALFSPSKSTIAPPEAIGTSTKSLPSVPLGPTSSSSSTMRMKYEWIREKEERHQFICRRLTLDERTTKCSWDILYRVFMKYPDIAQHPQIHMIMKSPPRPTSDKSLEQESVTSKPTDIGMPLSQPMASAFHLGKPIALARDVMIF
jgi:hypothetical protein